MPICAFECTKFVVKMDPGYVLKISVEANQLLKSHDFLQKAWI